jgi:O-antigen ligase
MKNQLLKLHWLVFVVLMAAPALLLVERKAGNLSFYALLLLAAAAALGRLRPDDRGFWQLVKEYWPLHLAMAGMLLAIFINQLALQNFVIKTYDYPSRMAFFVVILWIALLLPYPLMKQLQWAYVAGALLAAIHMYVTTKGGTYRGYVYFMPIIEFAQMAQLLGFLAVLSIEYEVRHPLWRRLGIALKLLAGAAGIYAAYLSQTRGAWIGIPVLLIITIAILGRHIPLRRQLALFVGGSAVLLAVFASTDLVQKRAAEAKLDISQYQDGKSRDTSLGIRMQLWKGSWLLYAEHPWVGVGREGYQSAMGELERRKIISPLARIQPHSHNEILYNMATLGTFGLLAILSLYLVPGYYFLREIAHPDREIRATAGMGLILCAGFLILGLVDVMFMWGTSDNFYSIVAAILFAFIIKRKKMLSGNPALQ